MSPDEAPFMLHTHNEGPTSAINRPTEEKEVVSHNGPSVIRQVGELQGNKVFVAISTTSTRLSSSAKEQIKRVKYRRPRKYWYMALAVLCILITVIVVLTLVIKLKRDQKFVPEIEGLDSGFSATSRTQAILSASVYYTASKNHITSTIELPTSTPTFTAKASLLLTTATSANGVTPKPAILVGSRLAFLFDASQHVFAEFFQAGDGSIRYCVLGRNTGNSQGWTEPAFDNRIPVKDVKLGTPLTATSLKHANGTNIWYLFYVDTSNTIRGIQREQSQFGQWFENSIGVQGLFEVNNASTIAFAVAAKLLWFDADSGSGLRLLATASDSNTIKEFVLPFDNPYWQYETHFSNMNGLGGAHLGIDDEVWYFIACGRAKNEFNLFHIDLTVDDQLQHRWTRLDPVSEALARPDTAICAAQLVVIYQDVSGAIRGLANTGGKPSVLQWASDSFLIAGPEIGVMPGTPIVCWESGPRTPDGLPMLFVNYQLESGEIAESYYEYHDDIRNYSDTSGWIRGVVKSQGIL